MKTELLASDRRRRPLTALEYLDAEEKRAFDGLKNSLLAAGDEISERADVRGVVARHPALAMGASAVLGAALAPFVVDALRGGLPALLGRDGRPGKAFERLLLHLRHAP